MSETPGAEFDEFIESIAPDVMRVLHEQNFFPKLQAVTYPEGPVGPRVCANDFTQTTKLLTELGHPQEHHDDVFNVMRARGGFCDCEIILNAWEESPIAEHYWRTRAGNLARTGD